jgi:hypothetical protein
MSISLIDLSYKSAQDPVGVDQSFTVTLSLLALGGDTSSTTVTFWTRAAYAVVPPSINIAIPPGQTKVDKDVSIQLHGQPQAESVRIYAECDERHSVFVRVK